MRSRLSFWSRQRKPVASQGRRGPQHGRGKEKNKATGDVRNESLGAAAQLTNHFLYSHIRTPREAQMGCVRYLSSPLLPALLIRQVTTVRVLAMGQRRRSLASGTWNSNPLSASLLPSPLLSLTHLKSKNIMLWGEKKQREQWLGKYLPKTNMSWWIWS